MHIVLTAPHHAWNRVRVRSCSFAQASGEDAAWLAWDYEPRVEYNLPFKDSSLLIRLDQLLPRICKLATDANDRKVKVSACETLHSIIIFMVGSESGRPTNMTKLFKRILPVVLRLACDVEKVAMQLFEPLSLQLITWFCKDTHHESPLLVLMFDSIMEGLSSNDNGALRDFCARCTDHVIKWTIKQKSASELQKDASHIRSLLKRLYTLILHPAEFKRIGGALAVNTFYQRFREEECLVDNFVLEMIVAMMHSLRYTADISDGGGACKQTEKAIDNLLRWIVDKKGGYREVLAKANKHRRRPLGWPDEQPTTLESLPTWIYGQMGRHERRVRTKAMQIFAKTAGLSGNSAVPNLCGWLAEHYGKNDLGDSVAVQFETFPQLSSMHAGSVTMGIYISWLKGLEMVLDVYGFFFDGRMVKPEDIFRSSESRVFGAVALMSAHIFAADEHETLLAAVDRLPVREFELVKERKCYIYVRCLSLLTHIINSKAADNVQWTSHITDFMVSGVLNPSSLGFRLREADVNQGLPICTAALLAAIQTSTCFKLKELFTRSLGHALSDDSNNLRSVAEQILDPKGDLYTVQTLTCGYAQLHSKELLLRGMDEPIERLIDGLMDTLFAWSVKPNMYTPLAHSTCNDLFDMVISFGVSAEKLMAYLQMGATAQVNAEAESMETSNDVVVQRMVAPGEMFRRRFENLLLNHFVRMSVDVLPLLAQGSTHPVVYRVLRGCLDLVHNPDFAPKWDSASNAKRRVCCCMCASFDSLKHMWADDASTTKTLEAIDLFGQCIEAFAPDMSGFQAGQAEFGAMLSKPGCAGILQVYMHVLGDTKIKLPDKAGAVSILSYISMLPAENKIFQGVFGDGGRESAGAFQATFMLQVPSDYWKTRPGSEDMLHYESVLKSLFGALVASKSWVLLKEIIRMTCRDAIIIGNTANVFQPLINAKLQEVAQHDSTECIRLMNECLATVLDETTCVPPRYKHAVAERILVPMLQVASAKNVRDFYVANVGKIAQAVVVKGGGSDTEAVLTMQRSACALVGEMFCRLCVSDVKGTSAVVEKAYCRQSHTAPKEKGNTLLGALVGDKHTPALRKLLATEGASDLQRLLRCAAYNALTALLSCTQPDPRKPIASFLLKAQSKGDLCSSPIATLLPLDSEKEYNFEISLGGSIKMRSERIQAMKRESSKKGLHRGFMSSQIFDDSTLHGNGFSQSMDTDGDDVNTTLSATDAVAPSTVVLMGEPLDDNELNRHECMSTIVDALDLMDAKSAKDEGDQGEMPLWMM